MVKSRKRAVKKNIQAGNVYIQATFNNTIVTITDKQGNSFAWSSAGSLGFKGSKKSTPYAAQVTATTATQRAMDGGLKSVDVFVKGPGIGRDMAIRALSNAGLKIESIRDTTPIPHNGCRPRKKPRN